jgi:hypothetical protein
VVIAPARNTAVLATMIPEIIFSDVHITVLLFDIQKLFLQPLGLQSIH